MIRLILASTIVFAGFYTSSALADKVAQVDATPAYEMSAIDEGTDLKQQLRQVRHAITNDNKTRALRILDRLIEDETSSPNIFSHYGIIYKKYDTSFRCDANDKQKALRIARQHARSNCFQKGFSKCQVVHSFIAKNGYIGSLKGTNYGYGCVGEATVKGSRH